MDAIVFQVIINGLLIGGFYALIGIGLNVIFGVMRVTNFSQGEFLMIGMYVTYVLNTAFGFDPYITLPISAVLTFICGALFQKYFINPLLKTKDDANQIFLTVALMMFLQNVAMMVFSADHKTVKTAYAMKGINFFGSLLTVPKMVSFVMVLVVAVGLWLFLTRTDMGKALRATSQNSMGASLVGINISRMYVTAFGIGTALAGIAGTLLVPFFYVFPHIGDTFTTRAFVVVVLGGLGSIPGAFIGGLVLGLLETGGGFIVGPAFKESLVFIVFIIILVVRSRIEARKRSII